jgi:hypothetical protein
MKWTELRQEIRKMRFDEVFLRWTESRLSQEEAARVLGICDRTFRRYVNRYEEMGLEGLSDKRLTQASFRRAPVDEVMGGCRALQQALPGLQCEAFSQLVSTGRRLSQLYVGEEHAPIERLSFEVSQAGRSSQAERAGTRAGHDVAPGR